MRAGKIISGIQQVGIGVSDVRTAWKWYHEFFGMDIRIFEEEATAGLMLPYTNGTPVKRHAALVINMHGGGGFEIWQHKDKQPDAPAFNVQIGDLGIFCCKIKTHNIEGAFRHLRDKGANLLGTLGKNPGGTRHFYVQDPWNNVFEFVEEPNIYKRHKGHNEVNGGVYGATIGISDYEAARALYSDILEYDEVVYDEEGVFEDLAHLNGGDQRYRRILLRHRNPRCGPLSKLLGPTQIELLVAKDREARKIYENRIWGDLGFIHLCFDVRHMNALKSECGDHGYPFTVDSADSFDMGVASGHFSYIEDPDGTLIEFVETHRLPIIKKLGWYMNFNKRNPQKALPNWMINTMAFGRTRVEDV